MRLSNRNKANYFNFLGTLVIMVFVFGVAAFLLEYFVYDYMDWTQWLLLLFPTVLLMLFYFRGRQIFEYDSDGEALNFKNRNVFAFLDKSLSDEFPKYKLLSYEVINVGILKRLYTTISSKKNSKLTLRYDVSYLTNKELNDLKFSLSKVIKGNKEQTRE
ncbi:MULTISPECIES: hypothetical protein [unclassified Kaistella]|uniref:hypothetical protein n=1 Tax=unclassified Kaistella TaxID=2762626 RepID=UPI002736700D|nr:MULTISPECIES: hypothetical protein [unclassified Kaistella]MDP2453938.1 hypothetical protein [Kaistella sp. SH11-4b]MDP2456995.1 hypothetical protein [Kaistella sp. SH40-3]MDP2459752.1 hypothetical protein [Kaistella sp. SH19-2b]